MKWTVLQSEKIFDEPWFKVRREKVQLPSGHILNDYYVLDYPKWIIVLGLTKAGQIIMVRQYRHGLGEISYELCAGVCDPEDKNPLASAKREMLEETGYGAGEWEAYMTLCANPGTHSNLSYIFLATGLEKIQEQQLEETEEITVHLFSREEVREMLLKNEIPQALHAAALWRWLGE
ncbi:MAG: NUDIX hydrolase [Saprospiraceae bacterium]